VPGLPPSTGCVSEVELVERARGGDRAAFGELVDRYQSAVYRTALAALRSPEEAEDVAQEAFLAAYRKIGDFRGEASFKTWLLAITWRRALDRRKSVVEWFSRFVAPPNGRLSGPDDPPSLAPSHEKQLIDADLQRHVRRLVLKLPSKMRDVLLLAATGEHTFEEIAALLGIPVGTVKWRASEGRRLLKERLTRLGVGNA
jgi:RNA polymerase sigma-70 factor (ECF subfamily)